MEVFEGENMQTQYNALGYKIDLNFYDYRLAVEIDEKGHEDRNINHEIERQEVLEKNYVENSLELILMKIILILIRLIFNID